MSPFLTIYTPTLRPKNLLACMSSVKAQTLAGAIQHLIVPDYLGVGIVEAFYRWPALYAPVVRGQYVVLMGDDDVLAADTAVEQLAHLAKSYDYPDVLIVSAEKGHLGRLPYASNGPPVCGQIDLNCVVTRRDVWLQHVHDYGHRYEGDFDHIKAMWDTGRRIVWTQETVALLLSTGAVSKGRPE